MSKFFGPADPGKDSPFRADTLPNGERVPTYFPPPERKRVTWNTLPRPGIHPVAYPASHDRSRPSHDRSRPARARRVTDTG
ncbi:hypothetical protein SGPA1_50898 [Streptomyces misionensis JCM 4497]